MDMSCQLIKLIFVDALHWNAFQREQQYPIPLEDTLHGSIVPFPGKYYPQLLFSLSQVYYCPRKCSFSRRLHGRNSILDGNGKSSSIASEHALKTKNAGGDPASRCRFTSRKDSKKISYVKRKE